MTVAQFRAALDDMSPALDASIKQHGMEATVGAVLQMFTHVLGVDVVRSCVDRIEAKRAEGRS